MRKSNLPGCGMIRQHQSLSVPLSMVPQACINTREAKAGGSLQVKASQVYTAGPQEAKTLTVNKHHNQPTNQRKWTSKSRYPTAGNYRHQTVEKPGRVWGSYRLWVPKMGRHRLEEGILSTFPNGFSLSSRDLALQVYPLLSTLPCL